MVQPVCCLPASLLQVCPAPLPLVQSSPTVQRVQARPYCYEVPTSASVLRCPVQHPLYPAAAAGPATVGSWRPSCCLGRECPPAAPAYSCASLEVV